MMNRVVMPAILVTLMALAGCGFLFGGASGEREYFILSPLPSETPPVEKMLPYRILVRDAVASRFIDSHKILFTEDPQMRSYYQLASWVESPARSFSVLLTQKLEDAGAFQAVARQSAGVLGDFMIQSTLLDFYHDISDPPGVARIRIDVELVDVGTREVIGRSAVAKEVPVERYDSKGAVVALEKSLNVALDEIVQWTAQSLSRRARAAS